MIISVKVYPGAKKVQIKQDGPLYKVYVTARAVEGQANKAVIKVIAKYMNVRKSEVSIIKGLKSREKAIKILS